MPPPRFPRSILVALLGGCALLAGCGASIPAMPPHTGQVIYASDTTVVKVRGRVRVDVSLTGD